MMGLLVAALLCALPMTEAEAQGGRRGERGERRGIHISKRLRQMQADGRTRASWTW